MANVITGIIVVALVVGAVMTLTNAALSSASDISLSWGDMTDRVADRARTELQLITADIVGSGTNIDISLRNSGQTALREFSKWDAVISYYATSSNANLNITRMTYTTSSSPSNGQWTVVGVYLNAGTAEAEVYEPNVFNPGEEMIVRLNVTPAIPTTTDNLATIGTANGVTLSAPFSR